MMFLTMDELIEEFQRNPQCSSGRLRLDHYLVLEATNEAAAHFLDTQELKGLLPFTVTWVTEEGWLARLYQNPFEYGYSFGLTIAYRMFGMRFMHGSGEGVWVRNDQDDNSMLEVEVAALPKRALELFSTLTDLGDGLIAYLDAPLELGSEAFRYRQII